LETFVEIEWIICGGESGPVQVASFCFSLAFRSLKCSSKYFRLPAIIEHADWTGLIAKFSNGKCRSPATCGNGKAENFVRFRHYVHEQNPTATEQSYEEKERADLCRRILDFHARFGYAPVMFFGDGQANSVAKLPKYPRPDSVVIVDTGNYYRRQRDGRIDAIEAGVTESRWLPSN
jgi:hypothetical protein